MSVDSQLVSKWLQHRMKIVYQLHPIYRQRNFHLAVVIRLRIWQLLLNRFHVNNHKCTGSKIKNKSCKQNNQSETKNFKMFSNEFST